MKRLRNIGWGAVALAVLSAVMVFPLLAQQQPPAAGQRARSSPSLYEALGQLSGIDSLATDLTARILQDSVIMVNRSVTDALALYNPADLHRLLVSGVCRISGGPCQIDTALLNKVPSARVRIRLTERQWNAGISDLQTTLTKYSVPADIADQLLMIARSAKHKLVPMSRPANSRDRQG
ncbi:MAG TPA: hypothetical protein VGL38_04920 [bacterium]|jgi:hypothetical protein